MPEESGSPPDDLPVPALAAGELPASLPAAVYDLVARHDRLPGVSPAAARAFLARALDRRTAGPLDLSQLGAFLIEKGADDEAVHEVALSLATLAPALNERVGLPAKTAALTTKERQAILQGFIARCPRRTLTRTLEEPPPAEDYDDYLSSVVTSSFTRYRRRRRLAVLAAVVLAAGCLGALAAYLLLVLPQGAHRQGAPAPPSEKAPSDAAAQGREARVRARVKVDEAEAALARGDLIAAEAAASAARALDEGYADAARVLAVIHARSDRTHEACRLMGEYVRLAQTPEPARTRLLGSACKLEGGGAER